MSDDKNAPPKSVYVASDESGMVKVGISRALALRMGTLGVDRRSKVSLEYSTPPMTEAASIERIAHSLLLSNRSKGEWFSVTTEHAIEAVKKAVDLASSGDMALNRKLPNLRYGVPFKRLGPPTQIHVTGAERAAIEAAAKAEDRSVSAIGRRAIVEWLRANGWLPPKENVNA